MAAADHAGGTCRQICGKSNSQHGWSTMRHDSKLTWFNKCIPQLKMWMGDVPEKFTDAKATDGNLDRWNAASSVQLMLRRSANATIFDCTGLPVEFVDDTGQATLRDLAAQPKKLRLPFPNCLFELPNSLVIYASEDFLHPLDFEEDSVAESDKSPDRGPFVGLWMPRFGAPEPQFTRSLEMRVDFPNGYLTHPHDPGLDDLEGSTAPLIRYYQVNGMDDQMWANRIAALTVGLLTLLEEKLVTQEFRPDPAPRLTAARLKRGQHPLTSDTRVLRIDVPALRYAANRTNTSTHESPCLHWRRGHWRVLHRGSEFESTIWINKCLVGDPDKGFVRKYYQLTATPIPMIEPTDA